MCAAGLRPAGTTALGSASPASDRLNAPSGLAWYAGLARGGARRPGSAPSRLLWWRARRVDAAPAGRRSSCSPASARLAPPLGPGIRRHGDARPRAVGKRYEPAPAPVGRDTARRRRDRPTAASTSSTPAPSSADVVAPNISSCWCRAQARSCSIRGIDFTRLRARAGGRSSSRASRTTMSIRAAISLRECVSHEPDSDAVSGRGANISAWRRAMNAGDDPTLSVTPNRRRCPEVGQLRPDRRRRSGRGPDPPAGVWTMAQVGSAPKPSPRHAFPRHAHPSQSQHSSHPSIATVEHSRGVTEQDRRRNPVRRGPVAHGSAHLGPKHQELILSKVSKSTRRPASSGGLKSPAKPEASARSTACSPTHRARAACANELGPPLLRRPPARQWRGQRRPPRRPPASSAARSTRRSAPRASPRRRSQVANLLAIVSAPPLRHGHDAVKVPGPGPYTSCTQLDASCLPVDKKAPRSGF